MIDTDAALDLAAIKARYAFLGEQPWRVGRKVGRTLYRQARKSGPSDIDNLIGVVDSEDDAEFIAHARTDVPALVAEVERLRSDLAIARQDAREEYARAEEAEQALVRAKSFRVDL